MDKNPGNFLFSMRTEIQLRLDLHENAHCMMYGTRNVEKHVENWNIRYFLEN